MGDIDWDVMPGQLQIRSAGLSVLAQRKKPTDKLDWTLGIAGSLLVAGSTPVNLKGQLIIQKGKCTGLEARVEVGPYQGVLLSSLMDAAAGADASKKAQEDYAAPPKLFIPVDNPSRPLVLAVALSNSASGWSLTKAEASLALDDFGWSPIDGLSIQSLLFTLKAQRGLPLSPPSTNPGQLVYAAYLRGVLDLAGLPLIAEVAYDSKKSVLTVRATAAENAVCSLQKLCGALSDKIAAIPGADINPTYDLKPVTDVERVPQGCPVDTDWVLHGNYGSQRQCLLLFEDSKLTRLNLSVIYQNPASNWKLSDGLQMVNLGIFFDASFETPASISDPSIAAFVYGTLSLSQGTIIFGFVGCSKTPDRKEFDVLLTVHHQPNKGLGKPPQDVMSDQSLVGQAIDITGLTLPSSVPADKLKLEDSVTSVDAAVRASFVSVEKEAPTVLISVAASLRVTGVLWKMLDNLELTDLAVGVKAVRKDTAPASPFQILGSIYGRAQVTVGTSNFDLWAHAVLDKKDSASEFLASITTCTAGMAKEPPVSSSLSPAQLTQLAPLGDFKLTVPAEQQPPADCPVQVETLINSVAARCEVRVTKTSSGSSEGDAWAVSKLTFSLAASGSWVVLPAKLTLNIASLTVAVTDPGIAVNRRVTAMLAARMMVGTSTALDALLTFSRAQSKTVISGTLAATSSTAINVVQMAGELVPGGQPGPSTIIPDKSTNLDIFPTAQIRFWLDANQPTMLIAGATNSGHLLYFLHRPDPQTDVYFWLLSLSIGNVTQVFPWIDASVTGAFALQDIGVEMINATLPVKTLVSYLVLAEGGGGDHESMHPQGGMGPQPQKSSPLVLLRNLDQTAELVAGAWIFATVNLQGGGTMTDALTLAVLPDSKPQITLYTNVHADTKNMDCCLQFSNFTFFGDSLVVNGVLVYSPSKNSIQGSATLTLKGLTSQGTPQLTAAFTMTSTETTILGRLAVEKQVNIDNPFDGMYNTSLAVTKVKAKLVKATQGGQPPTSAVTVRGSLRLGPPDSAWTARARAIFVNGQVRVVVGTMGDISTVEVVDELLEPGQPAPAEGAQQSGSWPINFPTFNFQSASIYYAKSVKPHEDSLVIDGITYQFGYCIAAKLSLFGHLFTITAYLPENRSGLKIQGTYDQVIDLSFAKLYGYTFGDKDLPWPTLEINTSNNQQVSQDSSRSHAALSKAESYFAVGDANRR